jgi:hypothetical protein
LQIIWSFRPKLNQRYKQKQNYYIFKNVFDFFTDKSSEDIPTLPSVNVNTQADKLLVQNVDAYYNTNVVLVDPRLIVRKKTGSYIVLPISGRVTIDTTLRKLGIVLPRLKLTDDIESLGEKLEILFQPDPRYQFQQRISYDLQSNR